MIDKGTVDCDELQSFHMALGKQQPVEGISGGRLGIDCVKNVRHGNGQDRRANFLKCYGNSVQIR